MEWRYIVSFSLFFIIINQPDFRPLYRHGMTQYKLVSVFVDYLWNRPQHFHRKADVAKDERDVTDHIIIITGSNTGIGKQTALELAKRGARVIMACRNLYRAEAAKQEILKQVPNGKLETLQLDLADSRSVREFSVVIHERFSHIDVLINNAGITSYDRNLRRTKEGFEEQMGVNYLNMFLLTLSLLDLLGKTRMSRIVTVSSMSFQMAELDVKNLNLDCGMENSNMSIYAPYGNSRLATILFTRELARRLGENANINTYALCPGAVFTRNIEYESFFSRLWIKFAFFNGSDGVLNTLHCTLSKSLENQSGKMYRLLDVWDIENLFSDQQALELWKKSEELVGITFKKP